MKKLTVLEKIGAVIFLLILSLMVENANLTGANGPAEDPGSKLLLSHGRVATLLTLL